MNDAISATQDGSKPLGLGTGVYFVRERVCTRCLESDKVAVIDPVRKNSVFCVHAGEPAAISDRTGGAAAADASVDTARETTATDTAVDLILSLNGHLNCKWCALQCLELF